MYVSNLNSSVTYVQFLIRTYTHVMLYKFIVTYMHGWIHTLSCQVTQRRTSKKVFYFVLSTFLALKFQFLMILAPGNLAQHTGSGCCPFVLQKLPTSWHSWLKPNYLQWYTSGSWILMPQHYHWYTGARWNVEDVPIWSHQRPTNPPYIIWRNS